MAEVTISYRFKVISIAGELYVHWTEIGGEPPDNVDLAFCNTLVPPFTAKRSFREANPWRRKNIETALQVLAAEGWNATVEWADGKVEEFLTENRY